ncbi:sigma factor-like helix-turn-helix DNA-binding protein [Exiguobacterium sp. CinTr1]|uniref:sigma factor-like helix-turn-helix DNA-binding protein n=1 Tax=Exiguobacterium sp. CinTr1 TaxID=2995315 RepID=UPI0022E9559F|nr:sigma factor-like helix-turn-helix DNA-binding protein [Exiguobacterium sp. CinTr1]
MSRLSTLITLDTQKAVKRLLNEIPKLRQMAGDGDIDATTLMLDINRVLVNAKLTERQRQVIDLRYVGGLTLADVGAALDVAPQVAHINEGRALNALVREFKRMTEDGDHSFVAHGKDVDA